MSSRNHGETLPLHKSLVPKSLLCAACPVPFRHAFRGCFVKFVLLGSRPSSLLITRRWRTRRSRV